MYEQSLSKNNVLLVRGDAKTYSPRRNLKSFNVSDKLMSGGNSVKTKQQQNESFSKELGNYCS